MVAKIENRKFYYGRDIQEMGGDVGKNGGLTQKP